MNIIFSKNALSFYQTHKKKIFKFLMVGGGAAGIYLGLFTLLWTFFHANHVVAVSVGYFAGATFHFLVNRHITFQAKDRNHIAQLIKYLILILINYVVNVVFVHVSILFGWSPYVGILLAAAATTIIGYLMLHWVFKVEIFESA